MQKKITQLQAYNATVKLFTLYYQETKADDLGAILGSMSFLKNKKTVDPAMWEIWGECLEKIFPHKKLQNFKFLTIVESLIAMGAFLEEYYGRNNTDAIVIFLEDNAMFASNKKKIDPVVWQNWLRCVDEVLIVKDSREYFYLLPKE